MEKVKKMSSSREIIMFQTFGLVAFAAMAVNVVLIVAKLAS